MNDLQGTTIQADASTPRARSYNKASGSMPKVLVIPLCVDLLVRTDGTSTPVANPMDAPQLRNLGPMIQQLRVHYVAESASSANFRAQVSLQWSVLGRTWSTPVQPQTNLVGNQTGAISGWYTNDANFGLLMRASVDASNVSGAATESARVTVILEIELKS